MDHRETHRGRQERSSSATVSVRSSPVRKSQSQSAATAAEPKKNKYANAALNGLEDRTCTPRLKADL